MSRYAQLSASETLRVNVLVPPLQTIYHCDVTTASDTGTMHRRIAAATGIVMASVLLSRILGFFRDWTLAHQMGSNAVTDAYNAAFTLPDFLNYLIAGGSLIGGVLGSRYGRRLSPTALRAIIVVVGITAIVRLLA